MKRTLAIDFGGTGTKLGIVNERGELEHKVSFPTQTSPEPDAWMAAVEQHLAALDPDRASWPARYAGLGVGVPGFVEFERGLILVLPNVAGWNGIPLAARLEDRLGLPTYVDNDVNMMALAECTYGAGRLLQDAVFLTLGTGVGGGLLLNGRLYRGAASMAGEIGHMTVDRLGEKTPFGRGELERHIGNRALVAYCVERLRQGAVSIIPDLVGGRLEAIDPIVIEKAALQGDALGRAVYEYLAEVLAAALASIAYLLQPQAFVIGGGVAKSGALLFDPLRLRLRDHLHPIFYERLEIRPAELGNDAGLVGAATLALKRGHA